MAETKPTAVELVAELILSQIEENSFLQAGISGGSGITFKRPEAVKNVAFIINRDLVTSAPTLQAKIDRLEAEKAELREGCANLWDATEKLKAEKAELVESCQFFISALETGLLVRDISKDGQPDWALKMLDFARQLEKAQAALSKHTPVSEQGAEQNNPNPQTKG